MITLVLDVFSGFSSIVSPLLTLSLTSIISSVMLVMFQVMIPSKAIDEEAWLTIISMIMLLTVLIIALQLSDVVDRQVCPRVARIEPLIHRPPHNVTL